MSVTRAQKEQVEKWVQQTLTKLRFGFLKLRIEWKDSFTARMGDANSVLLRVRFSVPLWSRASERERYETVVHEVCHIVAGVKHHHRVKPHGAEWRALMREAGVEPRRCHNVDRTDLTRRAERINISCPSCDQTYACTPYMAGQIASGNRICSKCKTRLVAPSDIQPTKRRARRRAYR